MNDDPIVPPERRSPREQALEWFGVMRGVTTDEQRAEFEEWLKLSAVNREAYSVVRDAFGIGKDISRKDYDDQAAADAGGTVDSAGPPSDPKDSDPSPGSRGPRHRPLLTVLIGIMLIGVIGGLALRIGVLLGSEPNSHRAPLGAALPQDNLHYALLTSIGEIRTFPLRDDSFVTLDTDSLLSVSLNDDRPFLRLERGRARFNLQSGRLYVVAAGNSSMAAQDSLFDVSLDVSEQTAVHMLHGSADIAGTDASGEILAGMDRHVKSGDRATYSPDRKPSSAPSGVQADDRWPEGLREYDTVPLSKLIDEANRYSTVKLVLADPSFGTSTVSGTFRIDDVQKVADRVAELFDLTIDRTHPQEIILRRR